MSPETEKPDAGGVRLPNALSCCSAEKHSEVKPNALLHQAKIVAPTLRAYQSDGAKNIYAAFRNGTASVCYTLPTGGGKTPIVAYIVAGAAGRGKSILLLAHRIELLEQNSAALARQGVAHGLIAPDAPETAHTVQVASVATLARRLDKWRDRFDLIVIDEAHHAVAGSWEKIIASQPRARVLGVTATPERLDGRGLGEIFGALIEGPSVAALIEACWLCRFIVFSPASAPDLSGVKIKMGDYDVGGLRDAMGGVVIGAAVSEYMRLCPGARVIIFAVDIKHSKDVVAAFLAAGVTAAHVDGETPAQERRSILAAFARGEIKVLSNVALFGEGFDLPALDGVIMLRPTQSLALYLQQVGRALRPAPGKERALILDFSGNAFRHGLPDAPRQWSLESKARRGRFQGEAPTVRRCKECGALNPRSAQECQECGADLLTVRERQEIAMQLQAEESMRMAMQIRSMSYGQRVRWAGEDEGRLRLVAMACGYKRGWIFRRLEELRGAA